MDPHHIGTDEDLQVAIQQHTAALKPMAVWTWGDNHYGKLGDGTEELSVLRPQYGSDNDWVAATQDMTLR